MTEKPFNLIIRVVMWMQIAQIIFAIPFTVGSIYTLFLIISGRTASILFFGFLAVFAYFGWANAFSTIRITEKSITVNVFYGKFRINWNEVEKIAVMEHHPFIAIMGKNKRVVLSLAFVGMEREKMLDFFNQQIEKRGILFVKEEFQITHQNARVLF